MARYEFVQGVTTDQILDATDVLFDALEEYQGEVIVKGEHPVHNAVVALERLMMHRKVPDHIVDPQPYKLMRGMSLVWFQMLWASRGTRVADPKLRTRKNCHLSLGEKGEPHPEFAKEWGFILSRQICFLWGFLPGYGWPELIADTNVSTQREVVDKLHDIGTAEDNATMDHRKYRRGMLRCDWTEEGGRCREIAEFQTASRFMNLCLGHASVVSVNDGPGAVVPLPVRD